MKIIDLLNKIANGEEVPKKILWKDIIFIYVDEFWGYMKENYLKAKVDEVISFMGKIVSMEELNDEVTILDLTSGYGFQTLANVFYKGIEETQK